MALTPKQRRARLRFGDGAAIARRTKRSKAHVHYVLNGVRRDAVVERAAAKRMQPPTTVDEAFGPTP